MGAFVKRLNEPPPLLADGATGTNLFNMGLQSGDAPEFWNIDEPEKIKALYQYAVDAGSDVFLTNTFGANASRLKLHNAQDRVRLLNQAAVTLAKEVVESSGRNVFIAGSMGPTGEIMGAAGTLSHDQAKSIFKEQAVALLDAGVDILWLETISAPEEYQAASDAFAELDADWVGTMSFDTSGRTMMGLTSAGLVGLINELPKAPVAFGANCGVGAADLLRTVSGFVDAREKLDVHLPIVAKGNAGIPKYIDGAIVYDGTPALMGQYAKMARDLGADVIGGCCGTLPEHLSAMRIALDNSKVEERPSLDKIRAALGEFSSEDDGTTATSSGGGRRSRRRRF